MGVLSNLSEDANQFFSGLGHHKHLTPQAGATSFEEDIPKCFNRQGQVCNMSVLPMNKEKEALLDKRMERLQADMQLRPKMFLGSQDVTSQMDQANEMSKQELKNMTEKVEVYERAHLDFVKAYLAYKKELMNWQSGVRGLEDDYALKWRSAMRMWAAREPLPDCMVGVVTPYVRQPRPQSRSWKEWLF
ncbi:unnamed protein product [Cladocopium goreaui]|uniref:Uncharacterized protein n=1 Tax=Cladocopium goreaui TaxID=2562237 RepID=A0A9P1DVX9_9DINO|nr:unnamed protein product [Cladocopium goreaui]|mmetsp:Transcript_48865/g.106461  ORF Transcript_48865/g.106461 Transcript_48865/m.106461 type:complete len:189 (-) Transcript_48865:14-580(-)